MSYEWDITASSVGLIKAYANHHFNPAACRFKSEKISALRAPRIAAATTVMPVRFLTYTLILSSAYVLRRAAFDLQFSIVAGEETSTLIDNT